METFERLKSNKRIKHGKDDVGVHGSIYTNQSVIIQPPPRKYQIFFFFLDLSYTER